MLFVFVIDKGGRIGGDVVVGDIDDYDGDVGTFLLLFKLLLLLLL